LLTASAPDERVAFLGEDPGMGCSEWSAEALWFLGYADEALKRLQVALDLADAPGRGFTRTSSQGHAARIHQYRREPVQTSRYALASLSMGAEYGYAYSVAVAKILVGWATAALGNASLGVTEIKEGIAAHRATGAAMDRPYFLALLAEALLVGADSDEALAVVRQALDEIPADRSFFYEAELHRLRGLALLNADTSEARRVAESSFRTALEIARAQESRALELRAAMSLARVMTEDGRRAEARDLLQPVYAWFTEGLDTPDLVEARELLAGLR
jgi:predicted ATPase